MGLPKKLPEFVLVALVCLMIGYGTGTVLTERKKMVTLEHSVTLLWSDGEFDEPLWVLMSFWNRTWTANPCDCACTSAAANPSFMPGRIGEIDVVRTPEEAAAKWSKIEWRPDGLHWASTATAHAVSSHTKTLSQFSNESAGSISGGLRSARVSPD